MNFSPVGKAFIKPIKGVEDLCSSTEVDGGQLTNIQRFSETRYRGVTINRLNSLGIIILKMTRYKLKVIVASKVYYVIGTS